MEGHDGFSGDNLHHGNGGGVLSARMAPDAVSHPEKPAVGLSAEVIQAVQFATFLRADVLVKRTTQRKCGYSIQPKVWFKRFTKPIKEMLKGLGLRPQKSYTDEGSITVVLNAVRGLEDFSDDPRGIDLVRLLNGRVAQPTTHDEVVATLAFLEEAVKSLYGLYPPRPDSE